MRANSDSRIMRICSSTARPSSSSSFSSSTTMSALAPLVLEMSSIVAELSSPRASRSGVTTPPSVSASGRPTSTADMSASLLSCASRHAATAAASAPSTRRENAPGPLCHSTLAGWRWSSTSPAPAAPAASSARRRSLTSASPSTLASPSRADSSAGADAAARAPPSAPSCSFGCDCVCDCAPPWLMLSTFISCSCASAQMLPGALASAPPSPALPSASASSASSATGSPMAYVSSS
mmetsp:Transcript_9873/g.40784  ORF Transcript_9873/g.40784 Transcript_9873/m.40784 type:complete len:237 (+) Transcript_9873:177-887(+)